MMALIRVFSLADSSLIGNYTSPLVQSLIRWKMLVRVTSWLPMTHLYGRSPWPNLATTWVNAATLYQGQMEISVTDMLVVSTDVWIATDGAGLFHYSGGSVQQYSSQNTLPSDSVVDLEMAGTYLLIGLEDAGVARRDLSTGNWLATWNTGNWLFSDEIASISSISGWIHILADDQVYSYNTSSLSFSSSWSLADLDLARSPGKNLIPWPSGGARAPAADQVLVDDGSGVFTILHPQVQNHGAPSAGSQQSWPPTCFGIRPILFRNVRCNRTEWHLVYSQ